MRKQKPLSAAVHAALMGAVTVSALALAAPAFAAVAPHNDMRPENGMSNMQWPQSPNTAKATKETSTQEQNEQVSPQQEAQNQGSAPSEKAPNGMSNQTWQNQAEHLSSWEKDFFWQGNTPGSAMAANRMAAKDSEPITHWEQAQNQGSAPSEKAPNGMSNQTWQNQAEHLSSWEKDFFWQGNTPGNQTAANRMAAKDSEPITHWG